MKIMTPKGTVTFALGVAALACWILSPPGGFSDLTRTLSISWFAASILEFSVFLYENKKRFNIIQTKWFKRKKPIRVTLAYLFRIEHNGKYLLIKRHKKDVVGYQPIGGTYKYRKNEVREDFQSWGIKPCHLVPRDEDTEDDLRLVINQRRNLLPFLKWFEGRKNREIDPIREFREELIEAGLLDGQLFQVLNYAFVSKKEEYVSPSPVFLVDEYRYADIFELIADPDQKNAIKALEGRSDELIFATPDEIEKGVTKDGKPILGHSKKIIPQ